MGGIWNWVLYIVYLHFSVAVSVITHNHNHLQIWNNKMLNVLTIKPTSVPMYRWIPCSMHYAAWFCRRSSCAASGCLGYGGGRYVLYSQSWYLSNFSQPWSWPDSVSFEIGRGRSLYISSQPSEGSTRQYHSQHRASTWYLGVWFSWKHTSMLGVPPRFFMPWPVWS